MRNFAVLMFALVHICFAVSSDSSVFKNGNALNGEIKSMNRGVLVLETDYSDGDFKIKWTDIQYIATVSLLSNTEQRLDLRVKFGGTLNYDNQPAEDASRSDYVVQSGFGWEW